MNLNLTAASLWFDNEQSDRTSVGTGPDWACVSIDVEQKGSELNSFSVY